MNSYYVHWYSLFAKYIKKKKKSIKQSIYKKGRYGMNYLKIYKGDIN
jgi:hypothetical protein